MGGSIGGVVGQVREGHGEGDLLLDGGAHVAHEPQHVSAGNAKRQPDAQPACASRAQQ